MNFLGKILVFLIFIMSVVFMTFAVAVYGTHVNWREVVERKEASPGKPLGLKLQLSNKQSQIEDLEKQIQNLESDKNKQIADKADAIVKLNDQREVLEKENALLIKERDELSKKEHAAVAALDASTKNLEKLATEVKVLRDEIRKTQQDRDVQFASVVKLTDQIHKAEGDLAVLQERNKQLAGTVAHARQLLSLYNKDVTSPLSDEPPTLHGKVLAINDEKMIEVSIGSDDGLKVNHTLEVFRGSKYIGRVVILTTSPDKSVAKILPEYTKTSIQKGDDVATRLKVS
jgi:hypothetical protein